MAHQSSVFKILLGLVAASLHKPHLEIFYPNGDSRKTKVQAADSNGTANYGVFTSSDGPHPTPGEKRPFELKADGQSIYKGTTTRGQVFLIIPGSGAGGCSVYAEGYQ